MSRLRLAGCAFGSEDRRLWRTCVQIELDVRVLLSLCAVVVGPALDDLHVLELEAGARRLRDQQHAQGDGGCDCECGRGEEAEDILDADKSGMHFVDWEFCS